MAWLAALVALLAGSLVWLAWRRPRQVARAAPFVSPQLRAGRNLPRNRARGPRR